MEPQPPRGRPSLTDEERRILLRLYTYPSYGWPALVSTLLALGAWFLYESIEGIFIDVETGRDVLDIVFWLMIVWICLAMAVYCYWMLYASFVRRGKTFQSINEKVETGPAPQVDRELLAGSIAAGAAGRFIRGDGTSNARRAVGDGLEAAAAVGTVATAYDIAGSMREAARQILARCGIPVPDVSRRRRLIAFGPALVIAAVAVFLMVGDVQLRDAKSAEIEGYLQELAQDYAYCDRTRWNDPRDAGISSHETYEFWAYLNDIESTHQAMLILDVDWNGTVQEVTYMCYLDPSSSDPGDFQAEVKRSDEEFGQLVGTLSENDVSLATDALAKVDGFSDDFLATLEEGGLYTPVSLRHETTSGLRVAEYYETDSETDFDQYTRPNIWVNVSQM